MTEFNEIPVIDVSPLFGGTQADIKQLIANFYAAYSTTGFGYIINHGISPSLLNAVFEASKEFHALPMEAKMAVELDHLHRGYIPINTSTDVN